MKQSVLEELVVCVCESNWNPNNQRQKKSVHAVQRWFW